MSKLSLGRVKLVQSTSVQMNNSNLAKIGVMPVVARRMVLLVLDQKNILF